MKTEYKEKVYLIKAMHLQKGDKLWDTMEVVAAVQDHDHTIEYLIKGSNRRGNFNWGQLIYIIRLEPVES